MKDFARQIGVLILILLSLSACGINPPEPDFCALYRPDKAECNPTDPSKPVYEIETIDMLGYQCVSPDDFEKIKIYLKEVARQLDKQSTRVLSTWP